MNPVFTLINLLAMAPAVLGREVGLQLTGAPSSPGWHALFLGPFVGYAVLLIGLCLLLLIGGFRLLGECLPEE